MIDPLRTLFSLVAARFVPVRFAPARFAPLRLALWRSSPARSSPVRSQSERFAWGTRIEQFTPARGLMLNAAVGTEEPTAFVATTLMVYARRLRSPVITHLVAAVEQLPASVVSMVAEAR